MMPKSNPPKWEWDNWKTRDDFVEGVGGGTALKIDNWETRDNFESGSSSDPFYKIVPGIPIISFPS